MANPSSTNNNGGGFPPLPNADTILLSADYVRFRLAIEGYDWEECPAPSEPDRLRLVMRNLCADMEKRYAKEIAAMVESLSINRHSLYDTFTTVAVIIFEEANRNDTHLDKINWGKIVTLYAFTGLLCVHCLDNGLYDLIPHITDWLSVFVVDRLRPWIQHHGGWDGLIAFYEERQNPSAGWSRWPTKVGGLVGVSAAVAAGAIALGRTLSS